MDETKPNPGQPTLPVGASSPIVGVKTDQPAVTPDNPEKLTPEEQMERFAKELKESDWGHQPC